MRNTLRNTLLGLCATLTFVGCGDQSDAFLEGSAFLDPVALDEHLVLVDTARNRAVMLDARGDSTTKAVRVALPFGPTRAQRRKGKHDEIIVLSSGRRSTKDRSAEQAALTLLGAKGVVRSYELGATPFDTVVQADDGRYAALLRTQEEDGRVLSNANQIAIVDLQKNDDVQHRTPPSFGHKATGAVFSPALQIDGEERRLLVVLSEAEVTLIDLAHPERRETVVQLGGTVGRSIKPSQLLWSTSDTPTLYVRGESSDDVFAFRLEAREATPDQNDFRPSINQLGGGSQPTDMALFDDVVSGDPRLLVVSSGTREAIVIDPSSSRATPVPLQGAVKNVLLFHATSPKDQEPSTRAFIYAQGSATVSFVDLDDIAERGSRNVEALSLGSAVKAVLPLLSINKVILLHDEGVTVLDLAQRTALPIASSVGLEHVLLNEELELLWVAPPGQPRIGTLDLETGATDEVLLDADIVHMVPFPELQRVAVLHASAVGYLTYLHSNVPQRADGISVRGFLISDIVERGAP